ncbi:MAG: tRNA pseudouridine(54/55) synthase Pus10 [Thermoplasmatota archaeon]
MALPPELKALCDRCLGRRLVGAAGQGPQCEAGQAARQAAGFAAVGEPDCPVCEGAFADSAEWLRAAREAAAPYSYETFQVGTHFPSVCEATERTLSALMGQEKVGETIRTEANRLLAAALATEGRRVVQEGRPDLKLVVDTRYWTCLVDAAPVLVRGRYTKERRDLPQTHWPCRRCQGRGCWECDDSGVNYADSVEDAVGKPAQALFFASGYSFHGAGREDIDARMLGRGRPFILEIHQPHRRTADLAALAAAVTGGVGVRELSYAAPEEIQAIKEGEYDKEYLAACVAAAPIAKSALLGAVAALSGKTLEQRTPERVSHRRADLVRLRRVHRAELTATEGDPGQRFQIRVLAASGTYIKEMVSGDEGRTVPSLSALLGVPAKVEALDVLDILDPQPEGSSIRNAAP